MVACVFDSCVPLTGLTLEFEIFRLKLDPYVRRLIGNMEGASVLTTVFKITCQI